MSTKLKPLVSTNAPARKRLISALEQLLYSNSLKIEDMLPAVVLNYDRNANIATVRPLIKLLDVQDIGHSRNVIAGIPVLSMGAGNFHISFPMNTGDLGWIHASDRDISQFVQSLKESIPNSGRLHSFSDAMFIPDVFRQYTIAAEDSAAMVIQSTNGATKISIRGDNIKITAPTKILLQTPTVETSANLQVDGNLLVNGTAKIVGDTNIDGVSFIGHGHISSSPGNRTSGGAIS